ncbi:MAG: phage tail protein [Desulfobacter sp.]|nr:MAG: phage tail protein [Desulfobacter sp.]
MPTEPQELTQRAGTARSRYYGKYRGVVTDNNDPENLGRLRVRVPALLGETETGWALPCLPFGGLADQGSFSLPELDARVWVEFEAGDLHHPIWTGTFWQGADPPEEAAQAPPTTRVFKTPAGHRLQFDDADGAEKIIIHHRADATIEIDENGSISLADAGGNTITLDARGGQFKIEDGNGNKMETSAAGITIEGTTIELKATQVMLGDGAGEPVIKGNTFLPLYMAHTHTSTLPGSPTTPPVPAGETAAMSMGVTSI